MMDRGHCDRRGVHAPRKFFHALHCFAAELRGYGLRQRHVCIDHGDQLNAVALLRQLVVHARMVLAERSHTNDCCANCTFVRHDSIFSEPGFCNKAIIRTCKIAVIARDRRNRASSDHRAIGSSDCRPLGTLHSISCSFL